MSTERVERASLEGTALRITTCQQEVIDGTVYAYDPVTDMLALSASFLPASPHSDP